MWCRTVPGNTARRAPALTILEPLSFDAFMTGLQSDLSASQNSSRSRPSRSRRRLLLKAISDGTPSRDAEPGSKWRVRNVSGMLKGADNGEAGHSGDDLVADTLAAFRNALRRADGAETPADLLGEKMGDVSSVEGLDYFSPAFQGVLSQEGPATEESGEETQGGDTEVPSLDYFTPALP